MFCSVDPNESLDVERVVRGGSLLDLHRRRRLLNGAVLNDDVEDSGQDGQTDNSADDSHGCDNVHMPYFWHVAIH